MTAVPLRWVAAGSATIFLAKRLLLVLLVLPLPPAWHEPYIISGG